MCVRIRIDECDGQNIYPLKALTITFFFNVIVLLKHYFTIN